MTAVAAIAAALIGVAVLLAALGYPLSAVFRFRIRYTAARLTLLAVAAVLVIAAAGALGKPR